MDFTIERDGDTVTVVFENGQRLVLADLDAAAQFADALRRAVNAAKA